jgi:membrane protein
MITGMTRAPVRFAAEVVHALRANRTKDMSAQLAFWLLLALFPFCIFVLTIIGFIPMHGLDTELLGMLDDVMPTEAAQLVHRTMAEIVGKQHGLLLAVSLVTAVWSASGGMSSTSQALNLAYRVKETRPWWRMRLRGFVLTLGAAGMIVIATAGLLIGPNVVHMVWEWFELGGSFDRIWFWARWPIVVIDLLFMLACLYYFLPNARLKFRIFSPGALLAMLLWIGASVSFRYYVSHVHSYAKTYGALGTAVILIIWLYLSSVTVILGGEVNAAFDRVARGIEHTAKVPEATAARALEVAPSAPPPAPAPPAAHDG